MSLLKKITFLLLLIFSFSCQTKLEKQGWQRTAVVSQLDTSTINKKDKEVVVVKIENFPDVDSVGEIINKPFLVHDRPRYVFNVFRRDSAGKIRNEPFPVLPNFSSTSDLAYYKWESDSVCLVKVLKQGNVRAYYKLIYSHNSWTLSPNLQELP
jgi:hypothetical protein